MADMIERENIAGQCFGNGLWSPSFSPDGTGVLLGAGERGRYESASVSALRGSKFSRDLRSKETLGTLGYVARKLPAKSRPYA